MMSSFLSDPPGLPIVGSKHLFWNDQWPKPRSGVKWRHVPDFSVQSLRSKLKNIQKTHCNELIQMTNIECQALMQLQIILPTNDIKRAKQQLAYIASQSMTYEMRNILESLANGFYALIPDPRAELNIAEHLAEHQVSSDAHKARFYELSKTKDYSEFLRALYELLCDAQVGYARMHDGVKKALYAIYGDEIIKEATELVEDDLARRQLGHDKTLAEEEKASEGSSRGAKRPQPDVEDDLACQTKRAKAESRREQDMALATEKHLREQERALKKAGLTYEEQVARLMQESLCEY